jgi:hypothetical protein
MKKSPLIFQRDVMRFKWAAFYSDCIHEVKPVAEGHRVTLTYSILKKTNKEEQETSAKEKDQD